jgi:hypothetical protein
MISNEYLSKSIIVDNDTYKYLQGDSRDQQRHQELYGPVQPGQIVEIPGEAPALLEPVEGQVFQGLLNEGDEYRNGVGGLGFRALKFLMLPVGAMAAAMGAGALNGNGAEAQGFQCSTYYDEEGNVFHAVDRGDSVPAHLRFLACSPDQLPTPVPPAPPILEDTPTPTLEATPTATATATELPPTATATTMPTWTPRPDVQPVVNNFYLQGGQGGSVYNSGNSSSFSGSQSEAANIASNCSPNGYPTYPYSNDCPQPPLHAINSGTQSQQNYAIASQEQNLRNYNINIINAGQPTALPPRATATFQAPPIRPTATFQPRP